MMRQPRKDVLREQLVLAADEIIRLKWQIRAMCEAYTASGDEYAKGFRHGRMSRIQRWWHRFAWWRK